MQLGVRGIGLLAPGLEGWPAGSLVLAGREAFTPTTPARPAVTLLPPAERRRCAALVAWALAAAQEAVLQSGLQADALATVFTSSDGDGDIVHRLCSALASPGAQVSPTDFHNSVHNAAPGYWSIGAHSRAASTALCAYDGSFAAGLLEAACQVAIDRCAVLLVSADLPFPPPLDIQRPARHGFAVSLVLEPGTGLDIGVDGHGALTPSPLPAFEGNAAAAALPLLAALARGAKATVRLPLAEGALRVALK